MPIMGWLVCEKNLATTKRHISADLCEIVATVPMRPNACINSHSVFKCSSNFPFMWGLNLLFSHTPVRNAILTNTAYNCFLPKTKLKGFF